MSLIQAIIIAIIEGITEFLPISSTAHMKFANPLIGVQQRHFLISMKLSSSWQPYYRLWCFITSNSLILRKSGFYFKLVIALIPAIIAGVFLKKHIDAMLDNIVFIAMVMIAGGIILLFIDKAVYQTPDTFTGSR